MNRKQREIFLTVLRQFFDSAKHDPCMKASHFAVYTALLRQWVDIKCRLPLETFGRITAEMARVSPRTYYRCIRDLHDFNYLHYVPSNRNYQGSRVYLKWCNLGLRGEEDERTRNADEKQSFAGERLDKNHAVAYFLMKFYLLL